jgi:hypothetical protein
VLVLVRALALVSLAGDETSALRGGGALAVATSSPERRSCRRRCGSQTAGGAMGATERVRRGSGGRGE